MNGDCHMKKWIFLFVLLNVFTLTSVSYAEEARAGHSTSVTMEEVVVTATKTKEKRRDIPNSVVILNEMDIQESSAESLGELLANELGIDWRTYGNYGGAPQTIRIRGMGNEATQIFINGVSINSPSLGEADVSRIPLNNVERIEVVKGSGSLLYGSGAMGGTINIITKSPSKDRIDFKVSAGYGNNNTYHIAAEQGMFLSNEFGYYLTANRKETDGFRDNGDLTHQDVSLKMLLDKAENLDIRLYGDYINRRYGVPGVKPPEGTQDFSIGGTGFYNSESASLVDRGADKDGRLIFKIDGKLTKWLEYNFSQDYAKMENYFSNRNSIPVFPKAAGEGENTWVVNKVATTEGNLNLRPFEAVSLLVGAEYKGYDYERESMDLDGSGLEIQGTRLTENHHIFSKGVYGESQYRPSRFLKLMAGFRYEKHSTFGNETLPRYGLVINLLENTTLKFNRGKHFRAPTMNDLFWPDDGFTRGNPDLKAETGWHSDVTLEKDLSNHGLFMTLSYFDWNLKDKIEWAENPNFPTVFPGFNKWTPSNVDQSEGSGWEIGTAIGPFNDFKFSFDYTIQDIVEGKTGGARRQALHTPKHQFKGHISYWTDFELTITATGRYTGKRPANYLTDNDVTAQNTLDSYWTADIKLEQLYRENWSILLEVKNLLNKEYTTYTGFFEDTITNSLIRRGYPGAGRSLFLSVVYEH